MDAQNTYITVNRKFIVTKFVVLRLPYVDR